MDARRAAEWLRGRLPASVEVEADDEQVLVFVRRDMLHLDADALHDRLAHWRASELAQAHPRADAHLSFRHAFPAAPHEASTLDMQEAWLGLEPTLAFDARGAGAAEVERFASLVPRFLELVEGSGRPAGYRSPDVGTIE